MTDSWKDQKKERKKKGGEMGKKTKQLIKTENLLSFWDVAQCSLVQMLQIMDRFPMHFLQSTSKHHCIKVT